MISRRSTRSMMLTPSPAVLLIGAAAAALWPSQAAANTAGETLDETGTASTEANTRRTFTPEDFSRFAPRSALDMARQIPGFSIEEGDGARGLGQADTNVLINGRRISGKSNGPVEALGRIPAEGLTGQVLNVVTATTGGITGQFRYAPRFRSRGTPARLFDGSISLAGGGEKDEWTLALENDANRRGDEGIELVFNAAGNLIDTRAEKRNFASDRPSLSGSYTRTANNGNVLSATGEVQAVFFRDTETSVRSGTISATDRTRVFSRDEDEINYEFGLDYQFAFGGGQLKLIGLHGYEHSPAISQSTTQFADGSPPTGSVFDRVADEYETIARAEYSFNGLGGNLLIAAEGVRNILDITSALDVRDEAGNLQPIDLPGATAKVDEDRAEISLTYSRALAPNLQFQASAGGEYSTISQSGAFGLTRTFQRPKGFVALDWRASDTLSLSGRAERVVGQLNFFDFLSSVDLNQDTANVTNAELVPQQSWVFEVEATIGLGALGSLNLRSFYEDITDIVDQIPIAGGGQAPGNVPSAEFYGVSATGTVLSEGLGWRGTRFDFTVDLTDSSVLDPLLGTPRRLSGNTLTNLNFDLRHDFTGSVWAIGASAFWNNQSPSVRLDEVSLDSETFGFISAFIENKDIAGLTIRTQISNLVNRKNRFDRTVFVDRAAGIVDFVEDRDRTFGMIFSLEIEGSF